MNRLAIDYWPRASSVARRHPTKLASLATLNLDITEPWDFSHDSPQEGHARTANTKSAAASMAHLQAYDRTTLRGNNQSAQSWKGAKKEIRQIANESGLYTASQRWALRPRIQHLSHQTATKAGLRWTRPTRQSGAGFIYVASMRKGEQQQRPMMKRIGFYSYNIEQTNAARSLRQR